MENSASTTFDSSKSGLQDLLKDIHAGKTQLPDFQRGWVWDDDHIKSLLASVSLSYPIGTVMLLETGGEKVRFRPRLIEGVLNGEPKSPDQLILDGQQRLTSLYQALFSGRAVETTNARKKPIKRWYYLNITKALNPDDDREEAIISLPEDRIVLNFRGEVKEDYSTTELECKAEIIPLSLFFDVAGLTRWQMTYLQVAPDEMQQRLERWNTLVQSVIQRFQQYQVPVIKLLKETPKEAVCQVFEKVNTGGVTLTVFELLTASFAADDYQLRDDWSHRAARFKKYAVLDGVQNTDFLQALSLLVTRKKRREAIAQGKPEDNAPGISCKRKDILKLEPEDYKEWADKVTTGFEQAARFLHRQKIFTARDVPYRTQIVPLAAILTLLGNDEDKYGVQQKLSQWFWCGILGELYGSAVESRFARDLPEVYEWINKNGGIPKTIEDANFVQDRLYTLRTRNSAAYKGISALLMRDGCLDFSSGKGIEEQIYFDDKIDIHHIFPRAWCEEKKIDSNWRDCVINKTPLSAKTNRTIGGNDPNTYLARLENQSEISAEHMDKILGSHLIEANSIRSNDFESFFEKRREALLQRIEEAIGKSVIRETVSEEFRIEDDYETSAEEGR